MSKIDRMNDPTKDDPANDNPAHDDPANDNPAHDNPAHDNPARDQLPQDLLAAATAARERAYVPYSHFAVGAALRTEDGRIFAGANVENASYGLSRCAEQSAVLAMVNASTQASERVICEVLVIADGPTAVSPCGACRQIIWEFGQNATVYMTNLQGDVLNVEYERTLTSGICARALTRSESSSNHPSASTDSIMKTISSLLAPSSNTACDVCQSNQPSSKKSSSQPCDLRANRSRRMRSAGQEVLI